MSPVRLGALLGYAAVGGLIAYVVGNFVGYDDGWKDARREFRPDAQTEALIAALEERGLHSAGDLEGYEQAARLPDSDHAG